MVDYKALENHLSPKRQVYVFQNIGSSSLETQRAVAKEKWRGRAWSDRQDDILRQLRYCNLRDCRGIGVAQGEFIFEKVMSNDLDRHFCCFFLTPPRNWCRRAFGRDLDIWLASHRFEGIWHITTIKLRLDLAISS
jgi:hypothetical protein